MKKILICLFLLTFITNSFAQKKPSEEKLRERLAHFQKMKRTGKSFVLAGLVLNAVGIPLFISGKNEIDKSSGPDIYNGFGKVLGGVIFSAVGQVALAGGITFWAFSSSRIKTYNKLLKEKDIQLSIGLTHRGAGLQLTF